MLRKLAAIFLVLPLAIFILFVSVFRSAQARYDFVQKPGLPAVQGISTGAEINYNLPYPGRVLPDSFLWPVKVARDKLWIFFTASDSKKAEIYQLLSDKRLVSARTLFQENKPELAVTTLTKAEKYLELAVETEEKARKQNMQTTEVLRNINLATLKHIEVMNGFDAIAPEDAKQIIHETKGYSIKYYNQTKDVLTSLGETPPENPFGN